MNEVLILLFQGWRNRGPPKSSSSSKIPYPMSDRAKTNSGLSNSKAHIHFTLWGFSAAPLSSCPYSPAPWSHHRHGEPQLLGSFGDAKGKGGVEHLWGASFSSCPFELLMGVLLPDLHFMPYCHLAVIFKIDLQNMSEEESTMYTITHGFVNWKGKQVKLILIIISHKVSLTHCNSNAYHCAKGKSKIMARLQPYTQI